MLVNVYSVLCFLFVVACSLLSVAVMFVAWVVSMADRYAHGVNVSWPF